MPLGTQTLGSAVIIHVGATSSPVTPLGGLVSWSYPDDVGSTTRHYYGQASSIAIGKHARTIQFTCDYESADTGQLVLFAAKASAAVIWVKILPDGTNGETLPCRVTSSEIAGPDVNGYTTATFTLSQSTDPAVVAGGFGT